jgi:hypothetical protein
MSSTTPDATPADAEHGPSGLDVRLVRRRHVLLEKSGLIGGNRLGGVLVGLDDRSALRQRELLRIVEAPGLDESHDLGVQSRPVFHAVLERRRRLSPGLDAHQRLQFIDVAGERTCDLCDPRHPFVAERRVIVEPGENDDLFSSEQLEIRGLHLLRECEPACGSSAGLVQPALNSIGTPERHGARDRQQPAQGARPDEQLPPNRPRSHRLLRPRECGGATTGRPQVRLADGASHRAGFKEIDMNAIGHAEIFLMAGKFHLRDPR